MPEPTRPKAEEPKGRAQAGAIDAWPFGPIFFVSQLRGFIRDRCPDREVALPKLLLHLADGQELDVCHVVAVAPGWIALAVNDRVASQSSARMRTELVPYGLIARVTLAAERPAGAHVGFDVNHAPAIAVEADPGGQSAEYALLKARGERA